MHRLLNTISKVARNFPYRAFHFSTGFAGARAANNSRHRGDDGRFYFESSSAESLNPRKR